MGGLIDFPVETAFLFETLKAKLEAAPKLINQAAKEATRDATEEAADIIRDLTPVGEGEGRGGVRSTPPRKHLVEGWTTRVSGVGPRYVGHIVNSMPYARALEEGRDPTIIRATKKRFLSWPGNFIARPRSWVPWPGFAGRHMGRRGMDLARPRIFRRYQESVERVLRTLFG